MFGTYTGSPSVQGNTQPCFRLRAQFSGNNCCVHGSSSPRTFRVQKPCALPYAVSDSERRLTTWLISFSNSSSVTGPRFSSLRRRTDTV